MEEQKWRKQVTLRLSDGFTMWRKVFSSNDKELSIKQRPEANVAPSTTQRIPSLQILNGAAKHSKKPKGHLDSTMCSEPEVQRSGSTECRVKGSSKKGFASIPTPRKRIPSDASTPKSLSKLDKYPARAKDNGKNHEKHQRCPSPYLGPNGISLVRQLTRDARKDRKRRRRKERREKKKKRRKVITRYPSMHIPCFPLPPIDQLRREFAETKEARLVTSNPKNGLIRLTNMIVEVQKDSIKKVYRNDGPFAFIAQACMETLDLFQKKMVAKTEDTDIAKFKRSSRKQPRELELINALRCIRERREKISAEVREMGKLNESMASGRLEASVCEKVYPLPQPILETAKFVREELIQSENLQNSHNKLSKIVMENLTIKLTERWMQFKKKSKERQVQRTMIELYNREIAGAGLPTVQSIVESLGAIQ